MQVVLQEVARVQVLLQKVAQKHLTASISCAGGPTVLCDAYVLSEVLVQGIKQQLETEMGVRGQKLVAAGGYKPKVGPNLLIF